MTSPWPFAVSTLGMPGLGLDEVCRVAKNARCDGLELRAHPGTGVRAGMGHAALAKARGLLAWAGLTALSVAGYVKIAADAPDDEVLAALRADIGLAADLGARFLRVFPGGDGERDWEPAARRLRAVAPLARETGVRVLIETHDSHPTGVAVRRILDATGEPETTGAIWDVLHTWRHGETPAATYAALHGHLGYVQIKDAAPDLTPVPLGEGDVPLTEVRAALAEGGYDGWISLEWERAWHPEVAPVEEILPAARAWAKDQPISEA
ncbi:sugar phosphate isomerase/epimerase family protein [Spongiactinospora sp. TRM90649]|uniref:sugar phosphate isomerase/epimerase family protein n=1 Tax=Spongiactinospora sp. TRM90649 TaxID=3031114 RepID=UPI0023F8A78F|nr:sugar phosphate isomerase/epimerase family protein [Spongiactinospora sp. TRM90649]MDF5752657.1 sugar phosphate isomerase/epimerase [Spongiactinospora sp. TRM90649]